MFPPIEADTEIPLDSGILTARVISATSRTLPFNQLTIVPDNYNESSDIKPDRLESRAVDAEGSTVYASAVPAGTYSLSSIRGFYSWGDRWYSNFVTTDPELGTFRIEPGRVTDLGTLIYYPKSEGDKYLKTVLRAPLDDAGEVIRKFFAFYPVNQGNILSWEEDGLEDDRSIEYISAVQNPVSYSTEYKAPDESLYFLSKLGVIIKRMPDGQWQMDAVDTNLNLHAIAQNNQGDLFVGGAEGSLYMKRFAEDWIDISLSPHETIEELRFRDDQTIDLLVREPYDVVIYRGEIEADDVNWLELNRYNTVAGWENTWLSQPDQTSSSSTTKSAITTVALIDIGADSYIRFSTRFSGDPITAFSRFRTFAYAPEDWRVSNSEAKPEMSQVFEAGSVTLGVKEPGFWSWSGKDSYYRYVKAEDKWEEVVTRVYKCDGEIILGAKCNNTSARISSFDFVTRPWFVNELEGISIARFSSYNAWSGTSSTEIKVLKTLDGGKSWGDSEIELPQPFCTSIISEVSDRLLVSCNGSSGDFYESTDMGLNWEQVRQHGDF